jgi:hypothetical protein
MHKLNLITLSLLFILSVAAAAPISPERAMVERSSVGNNNDPGIKRGTINSGGGTPPVYKRGSVDNGGQPGFR